MSNINNVGIFRWAKGLFLAHLDSLFLNIIAAVLSYVKTLQTST